MKHGCMAMDFFLLRHFLRTATVLGVFHAGPKIEGENWNLTACQNRLRDTKWMEIDVLFDRDFGRHQGSNFRPLF